MNIYVNKKEHNAINKAWEQVNAILESCNGDDEEEIALQNILSGLRSIEIKLKKKYE